MTVTITTRPVVVVQLATIVILMQFPDHDELGACRTITRYECNHGRQYLRTRNTIASSQIVLVPDVT